MRNLGRRLKKREGRQFRRVIRERFGGGSRFSVEGERSEIVRRGMFVGIVVRVVSGSFSQGPLMLENRLLLKPGTSTWQI